MHICPTCGMECYCDGNDDEWCDIPDHHFCNIFPPETIVEASHNLRVAFYQVIDAIGDWAKNYMDKKHPPKMPWRDRVGLWFWELMHPLERCEVCGRIERVLWWNVGCMPIVIRFRKLVADAHKKKKRGEL